MILDELKQVMPSFVSRVERPERGGEWVAYLERRREQTESWVARLGLDRRGDSDDAPSVELLHVDGSEEDLLASSLFESANAPETEILARIDVLDRDERAAAAGGAGRRAGPTAATGPAAASRRCATASRSSPTTAPSATCSATGC